MLFRSGLFQGLGKRLAVENIVAQDQADVVVADKFFADDECLRQAVGTGLFGIADGDAEIAAITEQASERWVVFRGGNNQDFAYSCQHQYGQGIVNHGFVVHGQELLGHAARDGIEACAAAAGKNDAFHVLFSFLLEVNEISITSLYCAMCFRIPCNLYF